VGLAVATCGLDPQQRVQAILPQMRLACGARAALPVNRERSATPILAPAAIRKTLPIWEGRQARPGSVPLPVSVVRAPDSGIPFRAQLHSSAVNFLMSPCLAVGADPPSRKAPVPIHTEFVLIGTSLSSGARSRKKMPTSARVMSG